MTPEEQEPVGSLAEEAAKLLRAVAANRAAPDAGVHGPDAGSSPGTAAPGQTVLACEHCPVCQLLAAAHHKNPELAQHLTTVLASVTTLTRTLLDATGAADDDPVDRDPTSGRHTTELSEDEPWD